MKKETKYLRPHGQMTCTIQQTTNYQYNVDLKGAEYTINPAAQPSI